ncbi:hypothetical protein HGM15179_009376 [Zosterops borbonicus]|uniref:Uncharacterized protein n=1 Tax=Zosterops borbonicus TaxID=364589 RepID=A0A8K1LL80_9PASS|nr:hypothetical protein HGM15179_009376 [Zosterops borbonicus]
MANPCEVLLQLLLLSQSLWLPVKPDVLPTGLKGGVPSGHNSHLRPAFSKSQQDLGWGGARQGRRGQCEVLLVLSKEEEEEEKEEDDDDEDEEQDEEEKKKSWV